MTRVNESWGNRIQWETKLVQPAGRFFFLLVSWCLLPENIILLITVFCHSSFYYTIWQQAAYWNENKWFKHLSEKQHNLWISIIFWIWSATDARIILNADSGLTVFKNQVCWTESRKGNTSPLFSLCLLSTPGIWSLCQEITVGQSSASCSD